MSFDQVSVEVNSDGFPFQANRFDTSYDDGFDVLFGSELLPDESIVAGYCDPANLVDSITNSVEPNEFDKYLGPNHVSNTNPNIDLDLLVPNVLPTHFIDGTKKAKSNKKPIALSSSVGVGVPQRALKVSHKIEIVNPLEETYRPRYKSDYFGQNGTLRKPRYVADRRGNHYVTLKVPTRIYGQIRVDWLTLPAENGDRYYMPYRFQANNEKADIADCNPIYLEIVDNVTGIMKLYLVLIKAKQDALKSLQPLQAFHPLKDAFGVVSKQTPEKQSKLTPKQLIQKYQLNKSQLAFTFCAIGADGKPCPEWDTTVFSTALEELSTENSATKTVACPNCAYKITVNDDDIVEQESPTNKRKNLPLKAEKPKPMKRQKNIADDFLYLC